MTDMKNLSRLPELKRLAELATNSFWKYDQAALSDGTIPKKYKELMAIAVALTTQCTYCIEVHRKAAVDAGATEEEFAETVHVAAALRAGAAITHGTHLLSDPS
ncbi:MAG: carboxymuconolactone decarboxylase family protein [Verrucomicrobiota bacterium]